MYFFFPYLCIKMKKYLYLSLLAVLALVSCTNEEVINQEFPNKYEKRISVVAEDLTPAEGTRTSYTDNGNGYSFAWSEGDALGIFPENGYQTAFPISEGKGVGTNTAIFDGGDWALKANKTYAAYYPLIHDFDLNPTAIPVNYTGQVQNGNGSTAHLGKYDFMASTFTEVDAKGNVNFRLQHLGCLVQFKLTMPEADTYTALEITSDKTPFITSAKYSLSDNVHAFYDVQTSKTVTIGLSNVSTTAEDKTLTITAMFAPVDLSDSKLTLTVIGNNGNYTFEIDGQKLSQGNSVNSNSTAESGLDANGNIIFADDAFKAYMVQNFDTDGDGEISVAEAKQVEEIRCNYSSIASFTGIEYCKNLKLFGCEGSRVSELDLSNFTTMTYLSCSNSTYLKKLNLSNCTALTVLWGNGNYAMEELNLTNCTALTKLICDHARLTKLDVSSCTALSFLNCSANYQMTELDVSNCTALTYLDCDGRFFDGDRLPLGKLTSIKGLEDCCNLETLVCSGHKLTSLDVSYFTKLTTLNCIENSDLTTIYISDNSQVTEEWRKPENAQYVVKNNSETQIVQFADDVFKAYMVENFDTNGDGEISIAEAEVVTEIDCSGKTITSLVGIEYCKNLLILDCNWNQLTSLDVRNNTALTNLRCRDNQLTQLDVSNNAKLTELNCMTNQLTTLDVSNNTKLTNLYCANNQLTSLDVSGCTELKSLICSCNLLTEIDVSYCTKLTRLLFYENDIHIIVYVSEGQTIEITDPSEATLTVKNK